MTKISTFTAQAVLFDMDGTLTDSIAAVEAAWGKVAEDIGEDPATIIAATHGKRAVDNLKQFKPYIPAHQMDAEVEAFEKSILYFADAYNARLKEEAEARKGYEDATLYSASEGSSISSMSSLGTMSPLTSPDSSSVDIADARAPFTGTQLDELLSEAALSPFINQTEDNERDITESDCIASNSGASGFCAPAPSTISDIRESWQIEAGFVDRSVRILPGVDRMIASIPKGRYAVATSGAQTYAYGCMTRVGIVPPEVTVTADDKRLKAGKPAPDPFLLAAQCLGYRAEGCVVFEDSPSGIRAGVASGATVIAVCTSHPREKIEHCGAHFLVETLEDVQCEVVWEGGEEKLMFTVQH